MNKNPQKVLIFAASSAIGLELTKKLINQGIEVYATSRKPLEFEHENLKNFIVNLSSKEEIDAFFDKINPVKFDNIINFQGVAICSPVENLSREELDNQFNISLYSLLEVLKHSKKQLNSGGKVINVSSMAAFGIFPFLSPYSMGKASADILLNCFEIETGIKTVSIKPGVVGTKFWKFSVDSNKENFRKFSEEYKVAGEFLVDNALKNSHRGLKPEDVASLIFKVANKKNPKASYLIGIDAYLASFGAIFKGRGLSSLIRSVLEKRVKGYLNGK